jgi:NMD protein affecting ribosome stability and mRNA decay|uniref:ATPase n=1 Tax=Desulfobacca acetoxidans TaxID=60893 RepID=A0A7V6A4J8_9BACT
MGRYQERKWSGEKGKKFGHAGRTDDPYMPAEGQEAAICTTCKALYQNKRWFFDEKLAKKLMGTEKVREVTCPTCRKIKDHYYEGVLTLKGEFFQDHQEEILTLIKNEAAKVAGRSVQDRIIAITPEDKDKMVIETTTEKLAQALGKAVYRAYKGNLDIRWSEMNKFVRVYWSR